jgi:hypothetical protein
VTEWGKLCMQRGGRHADPSKTEASEGAGQERDLSAFDASQRDIEIRQCN